MKKIKQKTKKSLVKKIKITKRGKLLRSHQLRSGHLRRNKSKSALRRYQRLVPIHKAMTLTIKRMLGRA